MKALRPLILFTALFAFFTVSPRVEAAEGDSQDAGSARFGLRGGYTSWNDVNQFHLGAHLKLGEIMPNVRFTPNFEAGFGDKVSIVTFNGDVVYDFTEFVEHPWNLYGGGSLSFNYFDPDRGESNTDLGLSALFGFERTFANDREALVEFRFGIMDSPDFKLTFGYTFF